MGPYGRALEPSLGSRGPRGPRDRDPRSLELACPRTQGRRPRLRRLSDTTLGVDGPTTARESVFSRSGPQPGYTRVSERRIRASLEGVEAVQSRGCASAKG